MTMNILDLSEMKELYGRFYSQSTLAKFNLEDVPSELRRIAHYANFWGLSDDSERMALIDSAPKAVLENLKSVVSSIDDELDVWLAGDEAALANPSDAYVAYSAMRMASDMA